MTCETPSIKTRTSEKVVMSPCFIEALRIDSNLELDWLWLASQNISPAERSYSLRRALAINPGNIFAQHALDELSAAPIAPAADFSTTLQPC